MQHQGLKENAVHGSAMFPLNVYSLYDPYGNYSLSYHWHKEIEIIYVEEGEIIFCVDMKPIHLSKGQYLFINSEVMHSAHASQSKASIHHAIVFDLNILSSSIYDYCQVKYIDPILNKSLMFPVLSDSNSQSGMKITREIVDIINIYKNKAPGWEIGIKASLFKIISFIARQDEFIKDTDTLLIQKDYKIQLVKKVLNYIHTNYAGNIYIKELASEANMNTEYFCRFFKSVTGKTPVSYINHYRIEQAAKLLQTGSEKIMEVCFNVGFTNFSYFIKKFKEYKNCTPSEYKNISQTELYDI